MLFVDKTEIRKNHTKRELTKREPNMGYKRTKIINDKLL